MFSGRKSLHQWFKFSPCCSVCHEALTHTGVQWKLDRLNNRFLVCVKLIPSSSFFHVFIYSTNTQQEALDFMPRGSKHYFHRQWWISSWTVALPSSLHPDLPKQHAANVFCFVLIENPPSGRNYML